MKEDNTDSYEELGYAKLDVGRKKRRGIPEIIFCEGKTSQQIIEILKTLYRHPTQNGFALATRANAEQAKAVQKHLPQAQYFSQARILFIGDTSLQKKIGNITILSAGTTDIPVAEEAAVTAELLGNSTTRIYDVGVAGLHRLMSKLPEVHKANIIIVVAGMDGALPSVVSGLVSVPVIAIPTSVGYGASFGGLAALLSMLSSCSPGISVVNIDNGFGAAYQASLINQNCAIQAK